jgi:hypothetical protein
MTVKIMSYPFTMRKPIQIAQDTYLPLTTTTLDMGVHSLVSGRTIGLLRCGSASKCAWTRAAIRDGRLALTCPSMFLTSSSK